MPRAKYNITTDDFLHANFCLSGRLRNHTIEFDEDVSPLDAEKDYRKAVDHKRPKKQQAELLNAWCEEYLSSVEWTKLKAAIRKRRERYDRFGDLKTVTISTRAHKLLSRVADRDEVTYSEVLEHYLAKALNRRPRRKQHRR